MTRQLLALKLPDDASERVRRSHHAAIEELQGAISENVDAPPLVIAAAAGIGSDLASYQQITSGTNPGGYWGSRTGGTTTVNFPVPVAPGQVIRSIRVQIREGSSAGETVAMALRRVSLFGAHTLVAVKTSGVRNQDSRLVWGAQDGLPLRVRDDEHIVLAAIIAATSAANEARIYSVKVN